MAPRKTVPYLCRKQSWLMQNMCIEAADKTRVAIIGGSFDPVTNGHIQLATEIVRSGLTEEVWLCPCGSRPDKSIQASPRHRYVMCEIAVNSMVSPTFPIRVTDHEVKETMATYDSLCYLRDHWPDHEFVFVIGSDWLQPGNDMRTWESKDGVTGHRLLSEFDFLVLPRPGYEIPDLSAFGPRFKWLTFKGTFKLMTSNISSSEVRKRCAIRWSSGHSRPGVHPMDGCVMPGVIAFIERHGLYRNTESSSASRASSSSGARPKATSNIWEIPGMKSGVLTGDAAWSLLRFAKQEGFVIPAFNCSTSSDVNAVLEAAKSISSPVIIQVSEEDAAFFCGESLKDKHGWASVLGAVVCANYVRTVACAYGIPVLLYSDRCTKKSLPWLEELLQADRFFWDAHGESLFSGHVLDMSDEPHAANISICARYFERMSQMNLILEIAIGGASSGVPDEQVQWTASDIWQVWVALSPISEKFTIFAAFVSLHGTDSSTLLADYQRLALAKTGGEDPRPYFLVLQGCAGARKECIDAVIKHGVVKMNVSADTNWAYWDGILSYYKSKNGYLQSQIGNPDGADMPNKSFYDPRVWLRDAEVSMGSCVKGSCIMLRNVNTLLEPQS